MSCLYILPLARPAQAKVQILTTSSCIVKSIPSNLVNLSHLYINFLSPFTIKMVHLIKNCSPNTSYVLDLYTYIFFLIFQCLGPDRASPTVDGADSESISCILCQEEVSNY